MSEKHSTVRPKEEKKEESQQKQEQQQQQQESRLGASTMETKGENRKQEETWSGKGMDNRKTGGDLEERSATKIQAGVRGFLVRKRQQAARTAAIRIQAGYRGFRARKTLKENAN